MDKIWIKNYAHDVPHTIDPDQYASIPEMLEECFKKYADSPCFVNFGETLTYKQVDELSQAYAGFLQTECKLQKGDRVAIMMPNCLQYPVALFGALRAGMVIVNISPLYNTQQINTALQETGAKCIVVFSSFAHLVEKALLRTQIKQVIVTEIGDLFPFPKRLIFNFVARYIKKMVAPWSIANVISFRNTTTSFYQKEFKKLDLCGNDLAFLQFTEGRTTGAPKCVMLTHRNFVANGLQISAWLRHFLEQGLNKKNLIFPLFKISTTSTHCLAFMRFGVIGLLITNLRDIPFVAKEINHHKPLIIMGARPLLNELLFNETFQHIDFSYLKLVLTGGMTVPKTLAEHWQSITNIAITEVYGTTETSPLVMTNPISTNRFTGSLGIPLPSTEVKICDEQDHEVPLGSRGEMWVRGPQVMKGYWNQPEETKKVLTEDGWFKTSDMGYMNEQGYFYFSDRKEDLIKTEGGIVYPSEVENVIRELPGVKDIVVVAGKSKNKSVIIRAYIIKSGFLSSEEISEESIITHCKRLLADYQAPHEVRFIAELPYSATGFVVRRLLREKHE